MVEKDREIYKACKRVWEGMRGCERVWEGLKGELKMTTVKFCATVGLKSLIILISDIRVDSTLVLSREEISA